MKYFNAVLAFASFAFASFALAGSAGATHKAWVLKHPGMACVLQYPSERAGTPGTIENDKPYGVYVTCPGILSSRGGGSRGPWAIPARYWMEAKQARFFVDQPRSPFWCQARAVDSWWTVYYGATNRWSHGRGVHSFDLMEGGTSVSARHWGGSLEDLAPEIIVQLDFDCRIGSSGSATAPGRLFGYDIAICQLARGCTTVRSDNRGASASVQGSGVECEGSTDAGRSVVRRGVNGMTNPTSSMVSIHCPVIPPVDDSYEHSRTVTGVELRYEGTRPSCRLESYDATGTKSTSPPFEPDFSFRPGFLVLRSFSTGRETSMSIQCDLPANATVVGFTARMSVTRISDGI